MRGEKKIRVSSNSHELIPGTKTQQFLQDAKEAGFLFFGTLFVSALEGTLFLPNQECQLRNKDKSDFENVLRALHHLFILGHRDSLNATEVSIFRTKGIQTEGFTFIANAFILLSKRNFTLSSKHVRLKELYSVGQNFPDDQFRKFQPWLFKYFLQRSADQILWTAGDDGVLTSKIGERTTLPEDSVLNSACNAKELYIIAFPRIIRNAKVVRLGTTASRVQIDEFLADLKK